MRNVLLALATVGILAAQANQWKFEVATVKQNTSGDTRVSGGFQPGGRYKVSNYTLRALIAAAYMRPQVNPDFLIAGGPKWIDSDHFDIDAKAADEFPAGPDGPSAPRRLMLQALLEQRFGLKVHHETRQGSVYSLTVVTAGKVRTSTADCAAAPQSCYARIGQGSISVAGFPFAQFVGLMPRFVDRMVTDATGLSRVDLELHWTPAPGEWMAPPIAGAEPPRPDGPSLFTALQEQLGLKLVPQTGPVDMLVIDAATPPSDN